MQAVVDEIIFENADPQKVKQRVSYPGPCYIFIYIYRWILLTMN